MQTLTFDLSKKQGPFKPLNATNGGPWHKRYSNKQYRSNLEAYKAARFPYSRNHDANLSGATYGGPFTVDVSVIFRDFSADVNDPAAYDFANTDECVLCTLVAGTKTFYRLGQSIENQIKKHDTKPPQDTLKWVQICEHIILHYTQGWNSGYALDMPYWEIWNEPDLRTDDEPAENKPTWGGTKAEFFDFFETAAKYLKGKFPQQKNGGPAVAFRTDWAKDFLSEMAKRNVPLDFFSWHGYRTQPGDFTELGRFYRALLDKYGYTNAENHVNEWNYIRDWTENFVYSIETIGGCKGAAFDMAAISAAQDSPIDMMMYYDTRPSSFCGLFDYYTYRPKKPYYVFYWYGSFYDCAHFIPCQSRIPDIFTLCGMYADGKTQAVLTYYTDKDGQPAKTVTVDLGRTAKWDVYLLDETHNAERIETTQCPTFTLQPNTCMLLKEVD